MTGKGNLKQYIFEQNLISNIHCMACKTPAVFLYVKMIILSSEATIQRCSQKKVSMQKIYRRTTMPKCDFNKFQYEATLLQSHFRRGVLL